jgi:hypothetical protein
MALPLINIESPAQIDLKQLVVDLINDEKNISVRPSTPIFGKLFASKRTFAPFVLNYINTIFGVELVPENAPKDLTVGTLGEAVIDFKLGRPAWKP